jgi:intracellular sulfur oxidation DsrE/DsrF family protein
MIRHALVPALAFVAACAPPPPAPPPPPPPPPAVAATAPETVAWRAVFHLSDPGRPANLRGLQNVSNGIKAILAQGDAPIQFVLVVHGPALGWFRRGEPDNLAEPLAQLLATGRVELRVCARTLEDNHWTLADILPGAKAVPSGTAEVIRLQGQGFAYFKP